MRKFNFEKELFKFLEQKQATDYKERLLEFKFGEKFLSGLILGREDDFSLVILTPSRILSFIKDDVIIFYLQDLMNLNFKYPTENKKIIELTIQLTKGYLKLTLTKMYPLSRHFLKTLQWILLGLKKSFILPREKIKEIKVVGFDISGKFEKNKEVKSD